MVCFVTTRHVKACFPSALAAPKHLADRQLKKHPFNIRLNSDDSFLAKQHLKQDFLQRFLALAQPKKYPFNIRLNSDDPCPPWII